MKHELINGTLDRTEHGIAARCVCGWTSGGHFSSMAASVAMRDHQDATKDSHPDAEENAARL